MRRTVARRVSSVLVAVALVASVVGLGPSATDPPAAQAQESTHSDWLPFVGEWTIGCTAALGTGNTFCRSHHNGWAVDLNIDFGEPIYAAGPGTVELAEGGCVPAGGDPGCNSGAGNYISIDHGEHSSRYIHLSSFADGVDVDVDIAAGQLIGFVGNSGTSGQGNAHLHYDELIDPFFNAQRIFFGPMLACHGDTPVQYPDAAGFGDDWQAVPWGTPLRNDGYECLGGVTPQAPPPPPPIESTPGGASGLAMGDFNNDGRSDMALGAPGEDIWSRKDVGVVSVVYSSASGLGGTDQTIRQRKRYKGRSETEDMFGAAVTTGDFDCDGSADLAVGSPGEKLGGQAHAGAVFVSYSGGGKVDNRAVSLYQGKWNLPDSLEAGDLTGAALAAGDIDGDNCDDLVIGSPGEDVGSQVNAGAVIVVYGTPGGFGPTSRAEPLIYQDAGFAGFTEASDLVGAAVASGDFNCDGFSDVAAGAPGESIDAMNNAGAVSIAWGGRQGLAGEPVTIFQSDGLAGFLERQDRTGTSLAVGDFNDDDCDDLAVGAPGEDLTSGRNAGAVSVSFGSTGGLRTGSVHFQGDGGLGETIEAHDNVGAAIVAVDFNCDGTDDLAVGAPGEDRRGGANAGWVGILSGTGGGMGPRITALTQGSGLPGRNNNGDRTGSSLAAGDTNGDGCGDLAIGVPGETVRGNDNAGRVIVVLGSTSSSHKRSSWSQAKKLNGRSEPGDVLGGPGIWELLGLSLQ